MKQSAMLPITPDNFDSCWQYIDHLRRNASRKSAIARFGGFLANLVLLFSLLFAVNGLIYSHFRGSYHFFLASIPLFSDLWTKVSLFLLNPGDTLTAQSIKLLLGAYGISILLFLTLALLISLIYHPRRRPVPEGTYAARTELLSKAAQEAWSWSYKTKISTSLASTLLVIVAAFALFFAYTIHLKDATAAQALLSIFPTHDYATNAMIYVLVAYFICHIFSTILLLLTRFIYRCRFPYEVMDQAETAVLIAQEESGDLTSEEIAAQRKERAAALRDDAISLEKEAAYRKAKTMFHDAALLGDAPAMKHYARHCLLSHLNDSARYWLEKAAASGEDGKDVKNMLLRLRLHLNHNTEYLRPDAAPLTKGQKFLRILKTVFSLLLRILVLLLLLGSVAVLALLLTDKLNINTLTDALSRLFS